MQLKSMAMALQTLVLLLLLCPDLSAAQAGSASAQSGPIIIVALVIALMAVALLVVVIVVCHFAWLRQATSKRRRAMLRRRQSPSQEPSTVPKGGKDQEDAPPRMQPNESVESRGSSVADLVYQAAADVQESDIEVAVVVPKVRSEPPQPAAGMRDTASQFLEFLSRKWNMQQVGHQTAPASVQLTTFKPSNSTKRPAEPVQLNDAFYDVCETDIGQYDNLTQQEPSSSGQEADRYEVAMELRDTRRSGASTPGLGGAGGSVEADTDEPLEKQQQQQQRLSEGETERYTGWFEEASEAM